MLLIQWNDRADHPATFLLRREFNFAVLSRPRDNVFDHLRALFNMGRLPAAKQNTHLYLLIVLKKSNGLLDFEIDIVLPRLGTHSNLF